MTIHKFHVGVKDYPNVGMPEGAKILSAQFQGANLYIWAMVDPSKEIERRNFRIFGTGHCPVRRRRPRQYVASYGAADGRCVWHLFEEALGTGCGRSGALRRMQGW